VRVSSGALCWRRGRTRYLHFLRRLPSHSRQLPGRRPSATTTAAAALIMLYLRRQTRIKSTMDFVARAFVPAVRK